MTHADFINRCNSRPINHGFYWGVNKVRLLRTIGWTCMIYFMTITVTSLSPAIFYFANAFTTGNWAQLAWTPVVLLAFLHGTPNMNLIDMMPWLMLTVLSYFLTCWLHNAILPGAFICLLTWFLSGLMAGIGMQYLKSLLCKNQQFFEKLQNAGCLLLPKS